MNLSLIGLAMVAALLMLGRMLGHPTIVGLFASLPFNSTSIGSLGPLGGATPPISTVFVFLLLAGLVFRKAFFEDIGRVFKSQWISWLLLALNIYVVAGAFILPRIFAGQTTALVPGQYGVIDVLLTPVPGNITQAAYFTLGTLTFFAFSIILRDRGAIYAIRNGFLTFATLQVLLGLTDLVGKLLGKGDVLAPIRTAYYTMHTETAVGSFWRITGGYPEASAFAAASLACLAFVFTYWRATGSTFSFILTLCLSALLLLSTSTTAYVALAILSIPLLFSLLYKLAASRITRRDITIVGVAILSVTIVLAAILSNHRLFDPFVDLLNWMVFDKLSSSSGIERAYWNAISLQSLVDTMGLGVGIGSSRSSSLVIAMLSQLGIPGTMMIFILVCVLVRGVSGVASSTLDFHGMQTLVLARGAQAAALGMLVADSLSGGSAYPSSLFFIALAILMYGRNTLQSERFQRGPELASFTDPRGTGLIRQ